MFFRLGWLEPALTSESCTDRFVNGWSYSWEEGRQLASMNNGTTSDTYKYNADGMRTQKTVNGVTTKYYLEGDQIAWQTDGTNTIHYVYDTDGNADYMLLNGSIYYYERNAQNDIIGMVDSSMNEVVTYSYDTWGKLLSIGGSLASTVGAVNPLRYRGYMYDTETGLYYLQSRYYDPNMGRFFNADDTDVLNCSATILTANIFMYCFNNPVLLQDSDGQNPVLIGAVAGASFGPAGIAVGAIIGICVIIVAGVVISHYNHYKYANSSQSSSSGIKNINWDVNGNQKHHILNGTRVNGGHSGWKKFGIDPKNPKDWGKLLPILKIVVDSGKIDKEEEAAGGGQVFYYVKYFSEQATSVTVKIWQSANGAIRKLSDAWTNN